MINKEVANEQFSKYRQIRYLRKARGLKVEDISEYMGFNSPQAVYKWQRGESLPEVENLLALSRLLGTTIESILVERTNEYAAKNCSIQHALVEHVK